MNDEHKPPALSEITKRIHKEVFDYVRAKQKAKSKSVEVRYRMMERRFKPK